MAFCALSIIFCALPVSGWRSSSTDTGFTATALAGTENADGSLVSHRAPCGDEKPGVPTPGSCERPPPMSTDDEASYDGVMPGWLCAAATNTQIFRHTNRRIDTRPPQD